MAEQSVKEMQRRLKAGRDYLASLRKLGFEPEAAFWALPGSDESEDNYQLIIISSWVHTIGPLAVYDLLFEAYDASATPKEIDPFCVSLFSPKSRIAVDFWNAVRTFEVAKARDADSQSLIPMMVLGVFDYCTTSEYILSNRRVTSTRFNDARRFNAFKSNIAKLAA
jgi:hypothetical protein